MPSLYTQSDSNKRKTWFLMSFFFIFVILVGWVFSQVMQSQMILYIAVAISIIGSFISYWGSDKIILTMSRAQEIKKKDSRELYNLVENLCITAGLPTPKIYLIPDEAINAFTTGRDAEHAIVVVTAGLLHKLEKREVEGVIAHELSHIGNRDILLGTVITVLVGSIVLMADWFMRWSLFGGSRRSSNQEGNNQTQLIITIVAIIEKTPPHVGRFAARENRHPVIRLLPEDFRVISRFFNLRKRKLLVCAF